MKANHIIKWMNDWMNEGMKKKKQNKIKNKNKTAISRNLLNKKEKKMKIKKTKIKFRSNKKKEEISKERWSRRKKKAQSSNKGTRARGGRKEETQVAEGTGFRGKLRPGHWSLVPIGHRRGRDTPFFDARSILSKLVTNKFWFGHLPLPLPLPLRHWFMEV